MAAPHRTAAAVWARRGRYRAGHRRRWRADRALAGLSRRRADALAVARLHAALMDDRADAPRLPWLAAGGAATALAGRGARRIDGHAHHPVLRRKRLVCWLVALHHPAASWAHTHLCLSLRG